MLRYAVRLPVQPGTSYALHPLSGSPVLFWKPIVSAVQWKNMEKQRVNVSAMLYLVLGINLVYSMQRKHRPLCGCQGTFDWERSKQYCNDTCRSPPFHQNRSTILLFIDVFILRSIAVAALHFRCKYWTVSVFVWWLFFPKLSNSWKLMFDQFHVRVLRILTNECVQH